MLSIGNAGGTISGSPHAIQSLDKLSTTRSCSDPHEVHIAALMASFFISGNGGNLEPQLVQCSSSGLRG